MKKAREKKAHELGSCTGPRCKIVRMLQKLRNQFGANARAIAVQPGIPKGSSGRVQGAPS